MQEHNTVAVGRMITPSALLVNLFSLKSPRNKISLPLVMWDQSKR